MNVLITVLKPYCHSDTRKLPCQYFITSYIYIYLNTGIYSYSLFFRQVQKKFTRIISTTISWNYLVSHMLWGVQTLLNATVANVYMTTMDFIKNWQLSAAYKSVKYKPENDIPMQAITNFFFEQYTYASHPLYTLYNFCTSYIHLYLWDLLSSASFNHLELWKTTVQYEANREVLKNMLCSAVWSSSRENWTHFSKFIFTAETKLTNYH